MFGYKPTILLFFFFVWFPWLYCSCATPFIPFRDSVILFSILFLLIHSFLTICYWEEGVAQEITIYTFNFLVYFYYSSLMKKTYSYTSIFILTFSYCSYSSYIHRKPHQTMLQSCVSCQAYFKVFKSKNILLYLLTKQTIYIILSLFLVFQISS